MVESSSRFLASTSSPRRAPDHSADATVAMRTTSSWTRPWPTPRLGVDTRRDARRARSRRPTRFQRTRRADVRRSHPGDLLRCERLQSYRRSPRGSSRPNRRPGSGATCPSRTREQHQHRMLRRHVEHPGQAAATPSGLPRRHHRGPTGTSPPGDDASARRRSPTWSRVNFLEHQATGRTDLRRESPRTLGCARFPQGRHTTTPPPSPAAALAQAVRKVTIASSRPSNPGWSRIVLDPGSAGVSRRGSPARMPACSARSARTRVDAQFVGEDCAGPADRPQRLGLLARR